MTTDPREHKNYRGLYDGYLQYLRDYPDYHNREFIESYMLKYCSVHVPSAIQKVLEVEQLIKHDRVAQLAEHDARIAFLRLWTLRHRHNPKLLVVDYNIYYICDSLDEAIALPRTTPLIARTELTLIRYNEECLQKYSLSVADLEHTVDILAYLGTLPEDQRQDIENNAQIWGQ